MTLEDHLRRMIGELFMTVAKLQADLDALRERVPPPPAPEGTPDGPA